MNTKVFSQPSAGTFSVVELVSLAQSGKIRVPAFQRPLRWGWEDVRRLFDSIVKGYPVGSLLLWKHPAPEGRLRLGALELEGKEMQDALWVVDGQQRITSLASALSEAGQTDDRFRLAWDVESKELCLPHDDPGGRFIPLPVIFDLQRTLKWFRQHDELSERIDEIDALTRTIREFKIPAYIVEEDDENVLRDIFDRMNNYGKRLRRAEIFTALHPSGSEHRPASFEQIIDNVDVNLGFGRLDIDTVLRAVMARRGGDVNRDIRLEFTEKTQENRDFGGESEADAYLKGGEAIERAVHFLVASGVPHVSFLPYRYLLVVLTRFFAHFPSPDQRNLELLRRWLWRAALAGPLAVAGSWTDAMRVLASLVDPKSETGSVQALLRLVGEAASVRVPDLKHFRTNQAHSRVALCALWALEPRSPRSGEKYPREILSSTLYGETTIQGALPSFFRRPPSSMTRWLSNRVFLLGDADQEFSPLDAFTQYDLLSPAPKNNAAILASHGLDGEMCRLLAERKVEPFLERRTAKLSELVSVFLQTETAQVFEDTPPLESFDLDDGTDEEDLDDGER